MEYPHQNVPKIRGQAGQGSVLMISFITLLILTAIGVWAAYAYGDGAIYIDGKTVSEMQPWEVIGGVVAGIFGLILALILGTIGLIIGIIALILALLLAAAGVAVGLFVSVGTALGPFLLIAAVILLLRKNNRKDDTSDITSDRSLPNTEEKI
ncbi:MAG: hypothetical protein ACWA5L_10480 [bacterium]